MRARRVIATVAIAGVGFFGLVGNADAAKPGPGDKQCIPGQQGNPHPAFKAGVCPNPGK